MARGPHTTTLVASSASTTAPRRSARSARELPSTFVAIDRIVRQPTMAPRQVEVILTQPETQQPAAAPESLAAVLAACGLQHHEKTFQAEGYTLDTMLSAIKQGDEAAMRDLRELKLNMGECRKLINHLKAGMRQGQESI